MVQSAKKLLDLHGIVDVRKHFLKLMAFRFYLADLFHQFGHGDGRQLNIEFFQKFPFIAHGGPEIKGSGGYLKYPDVFKGFHHIADCKEIPKPPAVRFQIPFTYLTNCRLQDPVFEEGVRDFLAVCNVVKTFKNI